MREHRTIRTNTVSIADYVRLDLVQRAAVRIRSPADSTAVRVAKHAAMSAINIQHWAVLTAAWHARRCRIQVWTGRIKQRAHEIKMARWH